MALFNNKEIESLQAENAELRGKIVHLKNEIEEYKAKLAKYISPNTSRSTFKASAVMRLI